MSRGTLDPALLLSVSSTGLSPSLAGLSRTVPLQFEVINAVRTPECTHSGLGSFHFARRYFENRVFFRERNFSFFSSGYLDVSVHRVPSVYLWIQYTVTEVCSAGFPHSDIRGSLLICSSPRLFAAYHVFLRLLVPRHPPCALLRLTFLFTSSVMLLRSVPGFHSRIFLFSCIPAVSCLNTRLGCLVISRLRFDI